MVLGFFYNFKIFVNWNIQEQYKSDFDKIKTLEVNLQKGDIIHIPSYWWFSIRFNKISSVCSFKYRTYMSTIAILPSILIHLLQKTNVKRDIVKKNENIVITNNKDENYVDKSESNVESSIETNNETKLNE